MASKPGILTDWPWKNLGRYKYVILVPWIVHSTYSFLVNEENERDLSFLLLLPFLLFRALHNQLWISLSRHRNAKGSNRIVDKSLEFDQVDRESNWDDQILLNGLLVYLGLMVVPKWRNVPFWRTDGVIITFLLHAGPVEFLYYWFHRALHHHFLYSRYHSHHHSSIVTEPITSVIHPFGELVAYYMLFAIPVLTTVQTNTASIASYALYIIYIDFMNNMGHCNFEFVPKFLFDFFLPLKYLMYTPSFHSLHHTQFRTNYSLFMPIYDYIYNTMDKSSDELYENSLKRPKDKPDVVHLTHLTTPESIYHLQIGVASWASMPITSSSWYLWVLRPFTALWTMILSSIHGHAFVAETLSFNNLRLQTWVIPRYKNQYLNGRQKQAMNNLIEEAILEADKKGVKVVTMGLLNQEEQLNGNGELYIQRNPGLKVKVVDGSSLAVAVVINSIPKGTTQVLFSGPFTKVAYALVLCLCQKGVQVATFYKDQKENLAKILTSHSNLIDSTSKDQRIWLVGEDLTEEEQFSAPRGTIFIPYSQFPPKKSRNDCFYYDIPAMIIPDSLQNMHACENWLPRRVMSAWRVAGILHALEEWNVNECGISTTSMLDVDGVWEASLRYGFRPLVPNT